MSHQCPYTFFGPHRQPLNELLTLYHVYDNLTQSPYIVGAGISCGNQSPLPERPWEIITSENMINHLDALCFESSYFISFYDNLEEAQREANRRRAQHRVFDASTGLCQYRDLTSVRIVAVDALVLSARDVVYFIRDELLGMLLTTEGFSPGVTEIFFNCSPNEWFVMQHVPEGAIIGVADRW